MRGTYTCVVAEKMDLTKMFGPLPGFVFSFPDCFLGLAAVVVGLTKGGVEPTNAFLPFGFALICLSLARRQRQQMSIWRSSLFASFRATVAAVFWGFCTWGCIRWWAMDVHVNEPWMRQFFRY